MVAMVTVTDRLPLGSSQPSPSAHGRSHSPVYANLQELKVCQSSLPPVPSGSPLHILNDWETHKDLSGRHFYYNRATGERTWKPPRTRDPSSSISSVPGDGLGRAGSEVQAAGPKGGGGYVRVWGGLWVCVGVCGLFQALQYSLPSIQEQVGSG